MALAGLYMLGKIHFEHTIDGPLRRGMDLRWRCLSIIIKQVSLSAQVLNVCRIYAKAKFAGKFTPC
jgi:hypothetical protein